MRDLKEALLNEQQIKALKEFKEKLLNRFDGRIIKIILYGSRARGERHWQSDVDVLVVVRKRTTRFDNEIIELETELDEKYNYGIYLSLTHMSLSDTDGWSIEIGHL